VGSHFQVFVIVTERSGNYLSRNMKNNHGLISWHWKPI